MTKRTHSYTKAVKIKKTFIKQGYKSVKIGSSSGFDNELIYFITATKGSK